MAGTHDEPSVQGADYRRRNSRMSCCFPENHDILTGDQSQKQNYQLMTKEKTLDRIDRSILRQLQADGRQSNVDLAKAVGLSPTPCLERVRRLEREGYITGYRALLNPGKLDAGLVVYVQVTLDRTTDDVFELFRQTVVAYPEVVECAMVAGGFDYLMKIRVADMAAYRRFLGTSLTSLSGVSQTHSYVVMEEVKPDGRITVPT